MELQIKEYQVPQTIDFNFEELKTEVANKMLFYKGLVYTDEQISEAKKDRATLRKFIDSLDSKRKEVKAEINAPYAAFEKKLNEIKALVQDPIQLIDNQVKEYEEVQKKEKENAIMELWHNLDAPVELKLTKIWNPKWTNVTYSISKIEAEMSEIIEQFHSDIKTITEMGSDFVFEGLEEYQSTLSLSDAVRKMTFLAEQKRRKEALAAEQAKKAEEVPEIKAEDMTMAAEQFVPIQEEPERKWVRFQAYISLEEARELKQFCSVNGIQIRTLI